MALKTNYVDDILDTSKNTMRKYKMITNEDGTVSFLDVTEYKQTGDSFGSTDVNAQNKEINKIGDTSISEIGDGTITGAISTLNSDKFDKSGGTINGAVNIGGNIKIWTDGEGGNIDIIPPSSVGGKWCIDAYNGNLRFFHYTPEGTINKTFTLDPSSGKFLNCVATNVYGTVSIANGGTGATTAVNAMLNLAPNHHTSPSFVFTMGSDGYGGGGGYSSIAELKTALGLNVETTTISSSYANFTVKKSGNVKFIHASQNLTVSMTAASEYTIGTLPTAYRPSINISQLIFTSINMKAFIVINTSGVITLVPETDMPSGTSFNLNFAYI